MNDHVSIAHPVAKGASAWAVYGFASMTDFASFIAATLASIYTLCLLGEWCWKRFVRDCFVRRGWLPPAMRRKSDRSGSDE